MKYLHRQGNTIHSCNIINKFYPSKNETKQKNKTKNETKREKAFRMKSTNPNCFLTQCDYFMLQNVSPAMAKLYGGNNGIDSSTHLHLSAFTMEILMKNLSTSPNLIFNNKTVFH